MVDGVIKGRWMVTIARELGYGEMKSRIVLGRMRHIEVRDLWLKEEVRKGMVVVAKMKGDENPADLMTKF